MRIVKYPPPEKEQFITCRGCKAELAYTGSDIRWEMGCYSDLKVIYCPICEQRMILESIPYPMYVNGKKFTFSSLDESD